MENQNTTEQKQETVNVEPILSQAPNGETFRYFKVQDGNFQNVIFTLVEIGFVPTKNLKDAPEDTPEGDQTAVGKILFENTAGFTTSQLLNDPAFGQIARDVFNAVIREQVEMEKALQEASELPVETPDEIAP